MSVIPVSFRLRCLMAAQANRDRGYVHFSAALVQCANNLSRSTGALRDKSDRAAEISGSLARPDLETSFSGSGDAGRFGDSAHLRVRPETNPELTRSHRYS